MNGSIYKPLYTFIIISSFLTIIPSCSFVKPVEEKVKAANSPKLDIYDQWIISNNDNTDDQQLKTHAASELGSKLDNPTDKNTLDSSEEESLSCLLNSTSHHRKKIVFLGFPVNSFRDSLDLGNIQSSYPNQIANYLDDDRLLSVNITQQTLPKTTPSGRITQADIKAMVKSIADSANAQFVISGKILTTGFQDNTKSINTYLSWNDIKQQLRNQKIRKFSVHVTLFDGFTGQSISSHIFYGESVDRQTLKNKPAAFSEEFMHSKYGKLIKKSLEEISAWIENNTLCLPLRAKIISHDDKGVTLNSGIENYLLPGDTFIIMTKSEHQQRFQSEVPESFLPNVTVTIKSVYPNGAYAELNSIAPKRRISKGDLVQSFEDHLEMY